MKFRVYSVYASHNDFQTNKKKILGIEFRFFRRISKCYCDRVVSDLIFPKRTNRLRAKRASFHLLLGSGYHGNCRTLCRPKRSGKIIFCVVIIFNFVVHVMSLRTRKHINVKFTCSQVAF